MAISAFALDAVSGAPEYTGKMLRSALSALLGSPPSGRPLGATSGVRPGTPTSTVSVSGSTVTIAPHSGVLDVQADATTGPYLYAVTAAETVALNAAHATYTRWDRIGVQLSDPAAGDGTSTPGVAIVYTPGTPAASPALPAAPARSLTLARVVVPQSGGGAATVVWLAPEPHQGVAWYTSEAARGIANPAPQTGDIAVIGSDASMQVTIWDGTAWRTIWPAAGWQSYTPALTNITLGNGTMVGRYLRQGDLVTVSVDITLGSTSAITGVVSVGLPLPTLRPAVGAAALLDAGLRYYAGVARASAGASVAGLSAASTDGTINATSPFTWTTGDSLWFTMSYQVA